LSRGAIPYDLPGVLAAAVEYEDGPTGCTLLSFEAGASCAFDVRGGAVAARDLECASLTDACGEVDALLFTGGSSWGLDAASGVVHRLSEERGGSVRYDDIPAVPTAAVYDFTGRDNTIYPDAELGVRAFNALAPGLLPTGRVGAGAHVSVGTYLAEAHAARAGQGAAFAAFGELKLLAFAVVNASGNVHDRQGRPVAGGPDAYEELRAGLARGEGEAASRPRGSNTVLLAVVTNVALGRPELHRLACMATAAAARLIEPFHTEDDGDVAFALSTSTTRLPRGFTTSDVGVLAGRLVQEAVLHAFKR
jgi:6-aminohexanoate-oligomer endohydrolase